MNAVRRIFESSAVRCNRATVKIDSAYFITVDLGWQDDQFSCLLLDFYQPCDVVQVVEHDTVGVDSTLTEV